MKKAVCTFLCLCSLSLASYASAYTVDGMQQDVNMKLTYPLVYLDNPVAQDNINKTIATAVQKAKDTYYIDKMLIVGQDYKITYEDNQYLSLIMTTSTWNGMGAHGYHTSTGYVFNKKTGEQIPLSYFVHINSPEQLQNALFTPYAAVYSESDKRVEDPYKVEKVSDNYVLKGNGVIDLLYQPYELSYFANGVTHVRLEPKIIEYLNR